MEAGIFFAVVGGIVFVAILVFASRSKDRSTKSAPRPAVRFDPQQLPSSLGVRESSHLKPLAEQLESALSKDYAERLKYRVLQVHPDMSSAKFDCLFFELKRYFLMTSVLRSVPMFSPQVDVIWHEMLMFTREYEQFCKQFVGYTIHHEPHAEAVPQPNEKAWFDWVYANLFRSTPYYDLIWRGMFQFPLSQERLELLKHGAEEEIREKLFNQRAAAELKTVDAAITALIDQGRKQLLEVDHTSNLGSMKRNSHDRHQVDMIQLAGLAMFYSMYYPGDYDQMMNEANAQRAQANNASSCGTGYVDTGSSDRDSGGGSSDGGGSDGGSSCSSCGGGCSS